MNWISYAVSMYCGREFAEAIIKKREARKRKKQNATENITVQPVPPKPGSNAHYEQWKAQQQKKD